MPDGSVGEILIAGDCLFSGYFKLEEETRRKLQTAGIGLATSVFCTRANSL